MRKDYQKAIFALYGAISIFCLPFLATGADLPARPPVSGVIRGEICFPTADAERILEDLEQADACKEVVAAGEGAIASSDARASALESRVLEQDRELAEARKLVEDTRKAGEDATKVAAGPWYQRVLSAGKWIALGLIVGFVGGMSK